MAGNRVCFFLGQKEITGAQGVRIKLNNARGSHSCITLTFFFPWAGQNYQPVLDSRGANKEGLCYNCIGGVVV